MKSWSVFFTVVIQNLSNIQFLNSSLLHQKTQQTSLQRFVAVNWNGKPHNASVFAIDVMTTRNSQKLPALPFNGAGKGFAGHFPSNSNLKDTLIFRRR
jgi:hypothetical protein